MTLPNSKIAKLLNSVAAAPYKLAPERELDLKKLIEANRVTIDVHCGEQGFSFSSSWMIHRVFTTLRSFEFLWANAYFNLVIYDSYITNPKGVIFDVNQIPSLKKAQELLFWGDAIIKANTETDWPNDLPSPETPISDDQYIQRTNHLFLGMCGFILLHEVGHIILDHRVDQQTPKEVKIIYEFEADKWAYDWILEKWNSHSGDARRFTVRTLSVASGLAALAYMELQLPKDGDRDHPTLPSRLIQFCRDFFDDSDGSSLSSAALSLISVVIHAHLIRSGIKIEQQRSYETVIQYLEEMDAHFPK